MRLIRKGQRSLEAGTLPVHCVGGPLDGETTHVPMGTKEFFAVGDVTVALSPNDLLPVWRYTPATLARSHGGRGQVFQGAIETDI